MTINKNDNRKNLVEIKKSMDKNGITFEVLYIDGIALGGVGFTGEKDRQRFTDMIEEIVNSSNRTGMELAWEVQSKLATLCLWGDKEISPDKEIESDEEKFIISFKNKKAYSYYSGEEIAECTIETDSEEIIETILTDRIKLYLTELRNSSCIEDEDEFWD